MFGWDQKERLLRESWTADALAQEIYAMFGAQVPNNTEAPVSITLPTGSTVAPIQLGNMVDGAPILTTRRPDGSPGDTLSIDKGQPVINGQPIIGGGGGGGGGGGSTAAAFPGMVTGGGPGMGPYTVDIFPDGIAGPALSVTVTQLSLSGLDTIPIGTWAIVIKVNGFFYMQVPVWVE